MEIVMSSSGCVLNHEVLILIYCLLMMVKWSDLVSDQAPACAGVAESRTLGALALTRRAVG